MFGKKVPNPEIVKFEAKIRTKGFDIVRGVHYRTTMRIKDRDEFLDYAKAHHVGIIFKEEAHWGEVTFFCLVHGAIITTTYLEAEVRVR